MRQDANVNDMNTFVLGRTIDPSVSQKTISGPSQFDALPCPHWCLMRADASVNNMNTFVLGQPLTQASDKGQSLHRRNLMHYGVHNRVLGVRMQGSTKWTLL